MPIISYFILLHNIIILCKNAFDHLWLSQAVLLILNNLKPNHPLYFNISTPLGTATSSVSGRSAASSCRWCCSPGRWAVPRPRRWSTWRKQERYVTAFLKKQTVPDVMQSVLLLTNYLHWKQLFSPTKDSVANKACYACSVKQHKTRGNSDAIWRYYQVYLLVLLLCGLELPLDLDLDRRALCGLTLTGLSFSCFILILGSRSGDSLLLCRFSLAIVK